MPGQMQDWKTPLLETTGSFQPKAKGRYLSHRHITFFITQSLPEKFGRAGYRADNRQLRQQGPLEAGVEPGLRRRSHT
jgi:hypothetical protein